MRIECACGVAVQRRVVGVWRVEVEVAGVVACCQGQQRVSNRRLGIKTLMPSGGARVSITERLTGAEGDGMRFEIALPVICAHAFGVRGRWQAE
ncbi:MAG TPA: hypothetical protein VFU94_10640 [Conexibacter sp.]|nr:hypothetical protein [Conexibacter sp.]